MATEKSMTTPEALDSKLTALDELIWANTTLHFRLAAVAQELHQEGEQSAGRRSLLRSLAREGPATVPQLARSRPVSRQSMQKLANDMLREGLVEFFENPDHQRSKLLRITPLGEQLLAQMNAREVKLGQWLAEELSENEIRTATSVVSLLRDRLAQSTAWRSALD